MRCPFCGFEEDKVVDSRESKEGQAIRRRRECLSCERRYTTYERVDEIPYMIVKKDNRREKFDRQKILAGLLRACEKRPVSMNQLEAIVNEAEGFFAEDLLDVHRRFLSLAVAAVLGGREQVIVLLRFSHNLPKLSLEGWSREGGWGRGRQT